MRPRLSREIEQRTRDQATVRGCTRAPAENMTGVGPFLNTSQVFMYGRSSAKSGRRRRHTRGLKVRRSRGRRGRSRRGRGGGRRGRGESVRKGKGRAGPGAPTLWDAVDSECVIELPERYG